MQPADPPLEVMLIIISVVTAAAALQAAGGMDWLVTLPGNYSKPPETNYDPRPAGYLFFYFIRRYRAYLVFHHAHHC